MIRLVFQKGPVSSSAGMLNGPGDWRLRRPTEMLVGELRQEIKGPGPRWDRTLQLQGAPMTSFDQAWEGQREQVLSLPALWGFLQGRAPTMWGIATY